MILDSLPSRTSVPVPTQPLLAHAPPTTPFEWLLTFLMAAILVGLVVLLPLYFLIVPLRAWSQNRKVGRSYLFALALFLLLVSSCWRCERGARPPTPAVGAGDVHESCSRGEIAANPAFSLNGTSWVLCRGPWRCRIE